MSQRSYVVYAALILFAGTIFFMWWRSSRDRGSALAAKEPAALIVVTNAEYPPFSFIDESDRVVGFDIDVVREVAKRMGKEVDLIDRPFDALIAELQTGRAQLAAAGMTPTLEREMLVLFTKPYFGGDPLVIVTRKSDMPVATVEGLHGNRVVVNEGFTADYYMSAVPGVEVTRLATVSDAFLALKSGRADAFVSARSAVKPFFKIHGKDDYNVVPIAATEEQYALVVSRKHADLLPRVQEALDGMAADGTLDTLKAKWMPQDD